MVVSAAVAQRQFGRLKGRGSVGTGLSFDTAFTVGWFHPVKGLELADLWFRFAARWFTT